MYTRVPLKDIVSITKGMLSRSSEAGLDDECFVGAYILSPLEEGSRDPLQNYGFIITWRNTRQDTRITSYSIGNNIEFATPPSSPGFPTSPRSPGMPSSPRPVSRANTLSRILSKAAEPVLSNDTTFAAFKALPIDPARSRRENGSFFEPADELTGVSNCKEAVDVMAEAIYRACQDAGGGHGEFIKEESVVRCVVSVLLQSCLVLTTLFRCHSLAEAQRMTSVYAKMEYGVKRLLWLGG